MENYQLTVQEILKPKISTSLLLSVLHTQNPQKITLNEQNSLFVDEKCQICVEPIVP